MTFLLQEGEVPKPVRRTTRPRKYPFHDLKPGQFFFAPGAKPTTMMSLASATGKRLAAMFQTRQQYMRVVGKVDGKDKWEACEPTTKGAVFGVGVYRIA